MGMTDTHADRDFCREMGEQIITIPVSKNIMLKSNGSQGNPYRNNQRSNELRRLGMLTATNLLHLGIAHTEHDTVDLLCLIHYPKRMPRVDPPNMWPSCKPIIDGFTEAGLWADDDSTHIRRTSFQQHPNPTGHTGLWKVEFHIIPLGRNDDELAITGA